MFRIIITSIIAIHMSATMMQATSTSSNPSNTPSLEAKANDLDRKVEFWTRWSFIFVSLTAISAVAYGICQGYLVNRQRLAAQAHIEASAEKERESAAALEFVRGEAAKESKRIESEASQKIVEANVKISTSQKESAEARQKASEANERATKAAESLALAEQHAADANVKAEGFRRDIAQANARAAEANRIAEQERLARLQLEARLADRVILPFQEQQMEAAFVPLKGKTVDVTVVGDTMEIAQFSNKIINAMRKAGVLLIVSRPLGGPSAKGVLVGVKTDAPAEFKKTADELVAILRQTGNGAGLWEYDQLVSGGAAMVAQDQGATFGSPLRIFIGGK